MSGDDEDPSDFLKGYGFTEEELNCVFDDLNSFRTIPGTTFGRYMNRIIDTIEKEDRCAFLKGVLMGIAIRKAEDALTERDLSAEKMRIVREIEKSGFS